MLVVFLAAFHLLYGGAWLPELGDIAGLASQPARGSCTLVWQTLGLQESCHTHRAFKWALWIPTPAPHMASALSIQPPSLVFEKSYRDRFFVLLLSNTS